MILPHGAVGWSAVRDCEICWLCSLTFGYSPSGLQPVYYEFEFEPVPEISNSVVCATSKASDQPAHTRSLIRAFACRLDTLGVLSY